MAEVMDMKKNAMEIVVDDGSERVPIKNTFGDEIGVFYFRPTDVGIVNRYNKIASDFDKITEPLENADIGPDGTASDDLDEESIAALNEAEKRLYEATDYLFDGEMSKAFFGHMHPFSPVGGRFYCEIAIEAVGQFISNRFDVQTDEITKRIEKYTAGLKRSGRGRKR